MTNENIWHGKPYYSLDSWCKNTLHHKCYKIALNAHMTCPNRDGHLDTRGCIFCSAGGSGDFAVNLPAPSGAFQDIDAQLLKGCKCIANKLYGKSGELSDLPSIIAYFQAYTNTYGPIEYLESVYRSALSSPKVCGISIATRPDCLSEEILDLLHRLNLEYQDKFIWIELGLQTIHEDTAHYIRRGFSLDCFETAVKNLSCIHIPVIVHVILGLPKETKEQMLKTITYLNQFPIFGIKLQLLHVLKHTDLAADYLNGMFQTLTKETYLNILIQCLESLSPDIVVHRVTGDGPKEILISPLWSANKRDVLNTLHSKMRETGAYQGRLYQKKPSVKEGGM